MLENVPNLTKIICFFLLFQHFCIDLSEQKTVKRPYNKNTGIEKPRQISQWEVVFLRIKRALFALDRFWKSEN